MSENYIQEELRKLDPDRYLVSLFAPRKRREPLWSLFLFNHEIAKTRFVVTETQLGLIRLQWWRQEINNLYEGKHAPDNPVLQGLEVIIRDFGLPQALFENIIFAREFDLEDVAPQGLQGLINYADLTTTPLNKMALQIIGDDPTEEELQNVSIRYCLVQLYRHIPHMKQHGLMLIPEELQKEVQEYLMTQEKIIPQSPVLKAQNALSGMYTEQLEKVHFDPLDPKLNRPPWFKEFRVFCAVLR